jgi:hypothetical protein
MCIFSQTCTLPVEGNFNNESGQDIKPRVAEDYNAYTVFVDKSDRTVNSYGITRRTQKWTKNTVFPPNRHYNSKRISYPQVVWRQNDA